MKSILNKISLNNLARLKVVSLIAAKEMCESFNITNYQYGKLKWDSNGIPKILHKDLIYGALRTFGQSNIEQIKNHIDYVDRINLTNTEIIEGLQELISTGHAYEDKENNYNYIQRLIEVFSNLTEKFVNEVELADFDIIKFKQIFEPSSYDYLMYEQFLITKNEQDHFNGIVSIEFDFEKYSYFLTTRQGKISKE